MLAVRERNPSGLQVRLTYFQEDCWFIAEDIRKLSRVSIFPGMKLLKAGEVRMEVVPKVSGSYGRTTIISIHGIRTLFAHIGIEAELDWFDRTYANYRALMRREAGVDVVVPPPPQPDEEVGEGGGDATDIDVPELLDDFSARLSRIETALLRIEERLVGVMPKNETPPTDGEYVFLFDIVNMGARRAHRIARELGVIGDRNFLILDSKDGAFALKPRLDSTGRTQVSLAANERGREMLWAAYDGHKE